MLLGHRPPKVTQAVVNFIQERGTVFALPMAEEALLAQKIVDAVPGVERVRLCNTGTEAVLYATRLARAYTGRNKIVRFEGMYHGFSDGVYWSKHPAIGQAGPDRSPRPVPQGPGLPAGMEDNLIILPWNDADALADTVARHGDKIAAVLTEPVMCNTGCILPEPGYLAAMRDITSKHGILLIFDEVITGFRLGIGGAQAHYGVTPDLSVFAKGLGWWFSHRRHGRAQRGDGLVADGVVSMAGTYTANGIAVAAANAAIDELNEPEATDDWVKQGSTSLRLEVRFLRRPQSPPMWSVLDHSCRCGLRRTHSKLSGRRTFCRPKTFPVMVGRNVVLWRAISSGGLRELVRVNGPHFR